MIKKLLLIMLVTGYIVGKSFANTIVGDGELKIEIEELANGAKVLSMKKNTMELMASYNPSLFELKIDGVTLFSSSGWGSVNIRNNGTHCEMIFSQPTNSSLSSTLAVTVTLDVTGNKSDWDLSISGLGTNKLTHILFPRISILASGSDTYFRPTFSGQVIKNPVSAHISSNQFYPRGWGCTMQFSAYYNSSYGIYLGTHDPTAATKHFVVGVKNGGLYYRNDISVPDLGLADNNYDLPGTFHMELFEGDWYEAAQIYKNWASTSADYWPKDTPARLARYNAAGQIYIFGRYYDVQNPDPAIQFLRKFQSYVEVASGIHWYNWNYSYLDDNYPVYFPERTDMDRVIDDLHATGSTAIMPYINGRLFETNLDIYAADGRPNAVKSDMKGHVVVEEVYHNIFADMCPTQSGWQNYIVDASNQLTNRIGADAVYVDQVAASSPVMCHDTTHNHTLYGGSYWRDGYVQMFQKMHDAVPENAFFSVEGCNDYLADVVDVFLTDGWTINDAVPAFQAVYSGKVQLLGTRFGVSDYNKNSFYCKFAQAFVNGIIPGRFYVNMIGNPKSGEFAEPYVRQLGRMRYKLREYLAFGVIQKPFLLDRSAIPTITSFWAGWQANVNVTISALQYSIWKNNDGDKAAIIFANASRTNSQSFSFSFSGSDYGLMGDLVVREIKETSDGAVITENNTFSKNVTLQAREVIAFIIDPDSVATSISQRADNLPKDYLLNQNYPNPFNSVTNISFNLPKSGATKLIVYNLMGNEVLTLVDSDLSAGYYNYQFNGSNLSPGMYIYRLSYNGHSEVKKMLLLNQ